MRSSHVDEQSGDQRSLHGEGSGQDGAESWNIHPVAMMPIANNPTPSGCFTCIPKGAMILDRVVRHGDPAVVTSTCTQLAIRNGQGDSPVMAAHHTTVVLPGRVDVGPVSGGTKTSTSDRW